MKHTLLCSLFLFGLLSQASSIAAVKAEFGGTAVKAAVHRLSNPRFLASYRGPSEYDEDAIGSGGSLKSAKSAKSGRYLAMNRSPGFGEDDTARLSTEYSHHSPVYGLSPSIGTTWWGGGWGPYVTNQFSLGMIVDFPMTPILSLEVEGGYANYRLHYESNPITGFHQFDQMSLGGNGKIYLWRGVLNPYVGGGLQGVYYTGLQTIIPFPHSYDYFMGMGQFMIGSDIGVSPGVSIGLRGSWMLPLFNRPFTQDAIGGPTGTLALPGYEEASMLNQSYYRLMGNVKVML